MERKTTLRNLGEKMQMIKVSVIFVRMIITSPLLAHNLQSQNSVLAAEYMREPLQAQEEAGYVGKMGGKGLSTTSKSKVGTPCKLQSLLKGSALPHLHRWVIHLLSRLKKFEEPMRRR